MAQFLFLRYGQPRRIMNYAQEKPDLEEQPERAPAGMLLDPDEIRKPAAEMVFLTFLLLHFLQTTSLAAAQEDTSDSKRVLHSWQRNS